MGQKKVLGMDATFCDEEMVHYFYNGKKSWNIKINEEESVSITEIDFEGCSEEFVRMLAAKQSKIFATAYVQKGQLAVKDGILKMKEAEACLKGGSGVNPEEVKFQQELETALGTIQTLMEKKASSAIIKAVTAGFSPRVKEEIEVFIETQK